MAVGTWAERRTRRRDAWWLKHASPTSITVDDLIQARRDLESDDLMDGRVPQAWKAIWEDIELAQLLRDENRIN
jgi:hypothetical protein